MDAPKPRLAGFLSALIALAIAGTVATYLTGRAIALSAAQSRLDTFATRVLSDHQASYSEAREVLAQMNASTDPPCSDTELLHFRQFLFRSQYLKDAARVLDGRVLCSATMGRLDATSPLAAQIFTLSDGVVGYRALPQYGVGELHLLSLRIDHAMVTLNPYALSQAEPARMRHALAAVDRTSGRAALVAGSTPAIDVSGLTQNSDFRRAGVLYATRCAPQDSSCVTAYITVADALDNGNSHLPGYKAVSVLMSAVFALLVLVLYNRKKQLRTQLLRAIRKRELDVLFQPIVDLATRRIVAAEALVRWVPEDGISVDPEGFVKVAETCGFVGELTRMVLSLALPALAPILQRDPSFWISVNVSAADLADPSFPDFLEQILQRHGVAPVNVGLELTESATANKETVAAAIASLRRRGHHICIDDFGTGYSSLAYLNELAVDAIKIDRSFTRAISTEAITLPVLPLILSLAENLNLRIIAEGIETESQAAYLYGKAPRILGQGYLFSRPLPLADFRRLLATSRLIFAARTSA